MLRGERPSQISFVNKERMMGHAMNKAERLREMERLYIQQPFSDIELAERLGVERTTVYRDRLELSSELPIEARESGRYFIDRSRYLSGIKLNLHEALALYLAARRASRQTRIAQPHVASALEKLATALKQPMTSRLVRAAGQVLEQEAQPDRVKTLEEITRAWAEQRKLDISYQALHSDQLRQHRVHPYLIEPSLWSDGVYLIGYNETYKDLYTFKIERVEQAYARLERFELPADFDEETLLEQAWGIWRRDQEPVTVRLRFFPGEAARRLKESIWHRTQEIIDLPDGGCEWSAQISEWQEMLPWVRGWGASVEVLAPEGLRDRMEREVEAYNQLYGLHQSNTKKNLFYAHSNNREKSQWQPLFDHLINTAALASEMAADSNCSDFAYIAGLLHDLGKYSTAFQERISGKKIKVDHTTAGTQEVLKLFSNNTQQEYIAKLLAACISGHHGGLLNFGSPIDLETDTSVWARLKRQVEPYQHYAQDIDVSHLQLPSHLPIKSDKIYPGFSLSFFTRMIYSSLVDADFQETETFMNGGKKPRGNHTTIDELCNQYNHYLYRFNHPENEINQQRTNSLKNVLKKAKEKPGFFTLTIPTGGGKTYASLAFALNHAKMHGLKHVIYVIPYTSIIEQNAAVFKECLGEENVLEHHSNFDWDFFLDALEPASQDDITRNVKLKLKLATENWDIPIVVTTNVQFFESLFSNRSSRCRKIHNLAKSVIIFDEAQMLPQEYLRPCLHAIKELVINYGASAIFCTATQPALDRFFPSDVNFCELVDKPQELYKFYKRVQIRNLGSLKDSDLTHRINDQDQVLCIVNTRKHAKGLFEGIEGESKFHLSTLMYPNHRKKTIEEIRACLLNRNICRVVSTQILEAGIDLDFPVGYRSLSGLDSIIQAAGRINREGGKPSAELFVFEPDSEFTKRTPSYIKQGAEVARSILRNYPDDPISIDAIDAYYNLLYDLKDKQAFDQKNILKYFEIRDQKEPTFEFRTASENFKLIENNIFPVIIQKEDAVKELLSQLNDIDNPKSLARKLQLFTVNIFENEFGSLQKKGLIDTYNEYFSVLNNDDFYDEKTGLLIPEQTGGDIIWFDG